MFRKDVGLESQIRECFDTNCVHQAQNKRKICGRELVRVSLFTDKRVLYQTWDKSPLSKKEAIITKAT